MWNHTTDSLVTKRHYSIAIHLIDTIVTPILKTWALEYVHCLYFPVSPKRRHNPSLVSLAPHLFSVDMTERPCYGM